MKKHEWAKDKKEMLEKIKENDQLKLIAGAELWCLDTWSIGKVKKELAKIGWTARSNTLLHNFTYKENSPHAPYNLEVDVEKNAGIENVSDITEELRNLKKVGLVVKITIELDDKG